MEVLKTLAADCLSPMSICLIVQTLGWLAIWGGYNRRGLTLFGVGTAILILGGLSGLTHEARRNLEYTFEPVSVENLDPQEANLIVVLGTGFNGDPALPANSQVSGAFLSRIVEGTRLFRALPNARMLISVAGKSDDQRKLRFLQGMTEVLRLDSERVSILTTAESTADEASETSKHFRDGHLLLVTSASHMKRAMRIFEDAGLNPTSAPTAYEFARVGTPEAADWRRWVPTADGVNSNHRWIYENAAMLWHWLGGK